MKNIKIIVIVSLLSIFFSSTASAKNFYFHGNVRNSIYSYEDSTAHTRVYQFLRMSLDAPKLQHMSVNASVRALSDLTESLDNGDRLKAYELNVQFQKLFNHLNVVLGRQFLHPGTVLGGLDGLFAKYQFTKNIALAAYSGVESHFNRSFKIYKTEDSFAAGGYVEWKKLLSSNFQLFYLQKSNDDGIFWSLTGLNLTSSLIPKTNLNMQAHYNTENSQLHRILLSARHRVNDQLSFSVGFKNQYPQVYANSYFTIFEANPYHQYTVGCSYLFRQDFSLNGQYQLLQFEEDAANRIFLTVGNVNGSFGLIYESGYAGEQLGLIADYAHAITPSLIASVNVDYSRYRTEKVYEFENQIANAARLSYRFKKHWSVDLEYQWLANRFKESDSRILNHIKYSW